MGEFDNSKVISPSNLPQVDVLEIDCEGAEMEILQGLCYRPRVLTVEAHPVFGVSVSDVESWLTTEGYRIVQQSSDDNTHHFTGIKDP